MSNAVVRIEVTSDESGTWKPVSKTIHLADCSVVVTVTDRDGSSARCEFWPAGMEKPPRPEEMERVELRSDVPPACGGCGEPAPGGRCPCLDHEEQLDREWEADAAAPGSDDLSRLREKLDQLAAYGASNPAELLEMLDGFRANRAAWQTTCDRCGKALRVARVTCGECLAVAPGPGAVLKTEG